MSSVEEQVRGIIAEQLGLKADEIKNDASFDRTSQDVWLNYGSTDKGVTWSPQNNYPRITPPIVLNASGYPGQQSFGTGDRACFSLAPTMDPSGNGKELLLTPSLPLNAM